MLTPLLLTSCTPSALQPWTGKIYGFDSNKSVFERKQANEFISTSDSRANRMVCMDGDDFNAMTDALLKNKCE